MSPYPSKDVPKVEEIRVYAVRADGREAQCVVCEGRYWRTAAFPTQVFQCEGGCGTVVIGIQTRGAA